MPATGSPADGRWLAILRVVFAGCKRRSECWPEEPGGKRWLVRYLSEGTPSLRDVAEVAASLISTTPVDSHSRWERSMTRLSCLRSCTSVAVPPALTKCAPFGIASTRTGSTLSGGAMSRTM